MFQVEADVEGESHSQANIEDHNELEVVDDANVEVDAITEEQKLYKIFCQ